MANASGNFILDKGFAAGGAIELFKFVNIDDTGAIPVTADTDMPAGVAQFHVTEAELLKGKGASVRLQGISECYVGSDASAPAPGKTAYLSPDADGSVTDNSGGTVVGTFTSDGIPGGRASVEINVERS